MPQLEEARCSRRETPACPLPGPVLRQRPELADVVPLCPALVAPAAYAGQYPAWSVTRADLNGDQASDGRASGSSFTCCSGGETGTSAMLDEGHRQRVMRRRWDRAGPLDTGKPKPHHTCADLASAVYLSLVLLLR